MGQLIPTAKNEDKTEKREIFNEVQLPEPMPMISIILLFSLLCYVTKFPLYKQFLQLESLHMFNLH